MAYRNLSLSYGRLAALGVTVVAVTAAATVGVTLLVSHDRPTASAALPIGAVSGVQVRPTPTASVAPAPSRSAPPGATASPTLRASRTPTAPTAPATHASPSRTPKPGTTAPTRTGQRPGDILDLSDWKLTLPIGSSNHPQEITQPTLKGYSIDPYFMVDPSRTGVIFQANAGGVSTSNSGYPRSELREMTPGGGDEASWSTTSGTSTMTVREAITHLTVVKPQVTVAQVHDDSDDVIVIRLDGPHHLYAEHNGTDYGDLDDNYVLGTAFTAEFIASGGHIKIFFNGEQKVDYVKSSSGDYFKAGCYTQSNMDKGDAADAYAQVVIYSLRITHTA